MSRSLELAQSKVAQLSSEITALKEAHSVVLETRDAMNRSLVQQNAQLTREVRIIFQQFMYRLFIVIDDYSKNCCKIGMMSCWRKSITLHSYYVLHQLLSNLLGFVEDIL